jgi:hypothetical protein
MAVVQQVGRVSVVYSSAVQAAAQLVGSGALQLVCRVKTVCEQALSTLGILV